MRKGLRQSLSMVAIFAIALHTVLWATVTPFGPAAIVDPFTIICHSEASEPASQTSDHGAPARTHACDHCNLCSATAPPVPRSVLAAHIRPARILQVLHPVNVVRHDAITANPKLARGPPVLA